MREGHGRPWKGASSGEMAYLLELALEAHSIDVGCAVLPLDDGGRHDHHLTKQSMPRQHGAVWREGWPP